MTQEESTRFELVAGALCLDFANTLRGRREQQPRELLGSYRALVDFGQQAGVVDARQAGRLLAEAERRSHDAEAARREAVAVREVIHGLFAALAAGRSPRPADLIRLNGALAASLAHRLVTQAGDSFGWGWDERTDALDQPLWPVVLSAAELLTAGAAGVRECAADDCGVLFVDAGRGRPRRWCSMQTCGNRAKVGRFRQRRRAQGTASAEEELDYPSSPSATYVRDPTRLSI